MPAIRTAKIVTDSEGQTVRLPDEFRLPGAEVHISRCGAGVLLEPLRKPMSRAEIDAIFKKLAAYHDIPFMENGREQPPMPDDDDELRFD